VIEFKLPELGENIEQGDLVRLMIAPGATVSEGQAVMELETDIAVVEVPSSVSGTVKDIRVKEGDKIKVGQVIFTVDAAGSPTTRRFIHSRRCGRRAAAPYGRTGRNYSDSGAASTSHPDFAFPQRPRIQAPRTR